MRIQDTAPRRISVQLRDTEIMSLIELLGTLLPENTAMDGSDITAENWFWSDLMDHLARELYPD